MSDYTWFKLLVRAIGVLLIGFGAPYFIATVWWGIASLRQDGGMLGAQFVIYSGFTILSTGLQSLFGLYLLFGGRWIIRYCLSDVRSRCVFCGYDLSGITSGVCPECGTPAAPPIPARRRPESPPPTPVD